MNDRKNIHDKAEAFFENLWRKGDPWELETSAFEQQKYEREIQILNGRHYRNVLEIGCGAGALTRHLAPLSERILALDISPVAISRARAMGSDLANVDFRVQNIMEFKLGEQGPWDLLVMNEMIYYVGWLYSFFDVSWFASELFGATGEGGQLLMTNTCGGVEDYLMTPAIIRTYCDLFRNVGYTASEEIFHGTKNAVELEVIIALFTKEAAR
jgi:cyclopropane fatty-acyl-phospholipid synthase-like methyltransferase